MIKRIPQIEVTTKRPADLTAAEIKALEKIGYKVPLAARIGRGPLTTFKGATAQ